ncbi:hypothetical protein LZ31DRAFT_370864 [Colletotrichum somersetense]|nr:hypothetical protein LZ31DRAFT_370864 [Colletotrichum somersetense]
MPTFNHLVLHSFSPYSAPPILSGAGVVKERDQLRMRVDARHDSTYFRIIHEVLVDGIVVMVRRLSHRIVLRVVSRGFGLAREPFSSPTVRLQGNTKPVVIYTVSGLNFRSFDLVPVAALVPEPEENIQSTRGQDRATASR